MRPVWRGKERNLITVGKDKSYDYTTPQAALDSVTDAAEDNPYLIVVSRGIYDRTVINSGYIDFVSEERGAAVIKFHDTISADTRGALAINNIVDGVYEDYLISDVLIDGFMLVHTNSYNPDPCLSVGRNPGNAYVVNWDRITIRNCIMVANQDCLRVWGQNLTGRMIISDNVFYCAGNAIGITTHGYIESSGNVIHIDSSCATLPFASEMTPDYQTRVSGIGCNPRNMSDVDPLETDAFRSVNDTIRIYADNDISAQSGWNNGNCAGILMYHSLNGNGLHYPRFTFINPTISVDWDNDSDVLGIVAGVGHTGQCETYPSGLSIVGGSIRVRNLSAGASSPDSVAGVFDNSDEADGAFLFKVYGTEIYVENNKGGGTAYSLRTANDANANIEARVTSDQGILDGTGSGITAITESP